MIIRPLYRPRAVVIFSNTVPNIDEYKICFKNSFLDWIAGYLPASARR